MHSRRLLDYCPRLLKLKSMLAVVSIKAGSSALPLSWLHRYHIEFEKGTVS